MTRARVRLSGALRRLLDRLRVRLGLPEPEPTSESAFVDALLAFERRLTLSQNRLLDALFDERAQRGELETLDRLSRAEERRLSESRSATDETPETEVSVLRERLRHLHERDERKRRALDVLRREFAEHQFEFLRLTRAYEKLRDSRALKPADDLLMRRLASHLRTLEREIVEGGADADGADEGPEGD